MKSLSDRINENIIRVHEGFFSNVGAELPYGNADEWFSKIAINATDQYLTKYDTKKCIRDNKKNTITFLNSYKKDNAERNFTIDLSKYVGKMFTEYDPTKILVEFGTGLYSIKDDRLKFTHTERIEAADRKGSYFDCDKKIRITVTLMPGSNPAPESTMITGTQVNKMLQYTNHRWGYGQSYAQHAQNENKKRKLLLEFVAYLNDYPFKMDDNIYELVNNLE